MSKKTVAPALKPLPVVYGVVSGDCAEAISGHTRAAAAETATFRNRLPRTMFFSLDYQENHQWVHQGISVYTLFILRIIRVCPFTAYVPRESCVLGQSLAGLCVYGMSWCTHAPSPKLNPGSFQ